PPWESRSGSSWGTRLRARAPVRPETPASGVLLVLACYGERGVARGYAGAAACVCAARGARRRPQPRPPGTPRRRRPGRPWGRGTPAAVAAVQEPARAGSVRGAALGGALHRGRRGFCAVQVFAEQQLAQLTQQLVQTEQHLNSLMAQLDPLFERVTTLAGAQQELLHMKLQTIHQLLQDSKPNKGVEVPEPEASIPFPEDFRIKEDEEEAGDNQAWEEPLNWNTGTRNLTPPREMEPALRRRCRKSAAQGLSHSLHWKEGKTVDGLVKQSLFL
uniref:Coiled-coil domain containing 107 n=1 Tax=Ovis aries TaxID=9940 RepID=A0AC11B0G1_SHEEP